jgi:outer membrane receptor protein involved in Fe transport
MFTLGVSYDDFNPDDTDAIKDENQFNPKFGVTWNPLPDTTLRAAAFRVLKRTLITDQTLEPTQVAGFNQFYDELNATDYWVYGGGIDQKFANIYIGAEYTYRDLEVPFNDPTGPSPRLTKVDWDEQIFRSYFFWTPYEWIGLSAEYIYEDLDRDRNLNLSAKDAETHYVPLGINFFHPSGLSASLKGTYVDQEGHFNRLDAPLGVTEKGEDDFWLLDAAVSYRLPKRNGFLTFGVNNLTDEDFEYYDSDLNNPRFQPDRFYYMKLTLAFP